MPVDQIRIKSLLNPRSIAVVGASTRSRWARMLLDNLERFDYTGELHLVNPRGGEAYGHPLVTSCCEITGPLDTALLLVPPGAVETALRDAAAGGAKTAVVLASGYAEAGGEGSLAQSRLVELSQELDLPFLGPNGLGFANLAEGRVGWLGQLSPRTRSGPVAVISQSGNIATSICGIAARLGVGISHVVATGNEAVINLVDVTSALVADDNVRVLAIFAEAISDPQLFLEVANRAADAGKPIVVLKAGRSELGQRLASTHTGAMAGDSAVLDAAFQSSGAIRVDSMEQLVATAGLLARTGIIRPGGLAMISVSGGTNDLLADRTEQVGVELCEFSEATRKRIEQTKPAGAVVQNPYDITGGAARSKDAWQDAIGAVLDDDRFGLVAIGGFEQLSLPADVDGLDIDTERLEWISEAVEKGGGQNRSALLLNAVQDFTTAQVTALDRIAAPHVLSGIDYGIAAVSHAMTWSQWHRDRRSPTPATSERPVGPLDGLLEATGMWSESASLNLFASAGIPVAPFQIAASPKEAQEAACRFGFPVVAKIASSQISHKSDIGGVRLDLRSSDEVADAFTGLVEAGERHASERVDGVLIAPMLPAGLDLIVGMVRDPGWGPLLLAGLGGIHAEAMSSKAIRLLPAGRAEIRAMLEDLSVPRLLANLRTTTPPSLEEVVDALFNFAGMVDAVGPRMLSAEINPLRLSAGTVVALDGLIEWVSSASPTGKDSR